MKKFKEIVKDELISKLNDYKGTSIYGCDMSFTLLEQYNIDGSYTYSIYESEELIKKHFREFSDLVESIKFNYGEFNVNLFEEPEKFIVLMLLECASCLLSSCEFIDDNWNNEITLNDETIKIISDELENVSND